MTYRELVNAPEFRRTCPSCVVCLDVGCEFCAAAPEPWPSETFALLGVADLERLVVDAQAELRRRAIA